MITSATLDARIAQEFGDILRCEIEKKTGHRLHPAVPIGCIITDLRSFNALTI